MSTEPVDRETLTPAQDKVLEAILELTKKNGWPPTLDEIGEYVGLTSKSTISQHLEMLDAKGWVKRVPGRSRAIRVIEPGENL